MKRICLTLLSIVFCAGFMHGISFDSNKSFSMGAHGGVVGQFDDMVTPVVVVSFSYKGGYIDIGGWPGMHGDDVRVDKWNDSESFSVHGGYIIPITESFRITPLVGYVLNKHGVTDGYNYSIGIHGIENEFHCKDRKSCFDYGGQITFNSGKLNLSGTITRYFCYVGIGFEIKL